MKTTLRQQETMAAEVAELLLRRAERIRQRPNEGEDETVLWIAEFRVGEDHYAIPLDVLRAAVPLKMVTSVPLSPPHVVGILRFQGQIVTALSLSSLLGGRGWREDPAVLLVVDVGLGRLVALDCEQIPKPGSVPYALANEARARATSAVAEITLPGLRQVNLLDLRRLVENVTLEVRRA